MAKITTYKPLIPHFEPIGHLYHDDAGTFLESSTTVLKAELGLYQFSSNKAAGRGTEVHKAAHYYDDGDLNEKSLTDEIAAYLEQYKKALAFYKIKVHANELMRYSRKYLFAGTCDKVVTIAGEHGPLDLKTGSVEKWHKWQTASYYDLLAEEFEKLHGLKFSKRWALYVSPTNYCLVEHKGARDFYEFLAFLAAHNLKINNGYRKAKAEQNNGGQ